MVTLLFSTHNGAGTLPAMLARLASIDHPAGLRIVAVDNGSSDATGGILESWKKRLPMQVIHLPAGTAEHPVASKNAALNFALDRLSASPDGRDLVVVTDDDIVPCREWLTTLHRAAVENPRADVFGGSIVPLWLAPPPQWLDSLSDCFPILFAATSAAEGPCSSHDVYGPNMAVRAGMFSNGLRFDPRIGPDGTNRFGMGSESELLRRLERAGHGFVFSEAAMVHHQIKPALCESAAVLRRGWRYGYGRAMMDSQHTPRAGLIVSALADRLLREAKATASRLPRYAHRRIALLFWREVARGYLAGVVAAPLKVSSGSATSSGRDAVDATGSRRPVPL